MGLNRNTPCLAVNYVIFFPIQSMIYFFISKPSRFIPLFQVSTKSFTNFSLESLLAKTSANARNKSLNKIKGQRG